MAVLVDLAVGERQDLLLPQHPARAVLEPLDKAKTEGIVRLLVTALALAVVVAEHRQRESTLPLLSLVMVETGLVRASLVLPLFGPVAEEEELTFVVLLRFRLEV
jgi:hypothetical protein